jgi:hypothetical protein
MVESCIVICFLCLLFLGLFQLAHAYGSREVLFYAAARAARAKTVGFNRFMVQKTMMVAAIPNAGRMIEPVPDSTTGNFNDDAALDHAIATMSVGQLWDFALKATPSPVTTDIELTRIPEFLDSDNMDQALDVLNYAGWSTITMLPPIMGAGVGGGAPDAAQAISITVCQTYTNMLISLAALNAGDITQNSQQDGLPLSGTYQIEAHYPLYLNTSQVEQ